jgi:hypothetical protein
MLLLLVVNAQAANDSGEILGYEPVPLYVLNNDAPGTTLSSVTQPDHGTAVIDGEVVIYTADQGYQGSDKFDYSTSGPGEGVSRSACRCAAIPWITQSSSDLRKTRFLPPNLSPT